MIYVLALGVWRKTFGLRLNAWCVGANGLYFQTLSLFSCQTRIPLKAHRLIRVVTVKTSVFCPVTSMTPR